MAPIRLFMIAAISLIASSGHTLAQPRYDTGASDKEIKIGTIGPFSGPASAWGAIPKTLLAYFKMVNDSGGVRGRKVNLIAYDDAYSPPKTVEQTRKLVEGDEVLAMAAIVGTAGNVAVQKYLNQKRIPQLFIGSAAARWADPANFPWSIGWLPSYRNEGRIYAQYIKEKYPDKKVGVLYQNDDFGRDYLAGIADVFGADKAKVVVAELPFDISAPSVEAQIVQLKSLNVEVFINISSPKFAAQAIRKIGELQWKPVHFITNVSISVTAVMKPAGLEYGQGVMSAAYLKDPNDVKWKDDAGLASFRTFVKKWMPEGDPNDAQLVYGYGVAQTFHKMLEQCGDDLTRANLMKQAAAMDFQSDVTLPGIRVKTSPTDFSPIEQVQMMRFEGESWHLFGEILDSSEPAAK